MKITKALKMRIYPNKEQALKIDKTIGSCRYVYNHMLARNEKYINVVMNIYRIMTCRTFYQA